MKAVTTNLKNLIFAVALTLAVTGIGLPSSAFATTSPVTPSVTEVTGEVTYNGAPVEEANVSVVCNGNTLTDQVVPGDEGAYRVDFNKADCPAGTEVVVTAVSGSMSGTSTGTAGKFTSKLNVAVVNVSVPEMGTVAAIGAMGAVGGAFFIARRRQMQF